MKLIVNHQTCTLCECCISACPFSAIDIIEGKIEMNAACKMCGICVKTCPVVAISMVKEERIGVDKEAWKGIMVVAETTRTGLHEVTLELLGKARELADEIGHSVGCVLLSNDNAPKQIEKILSHGADVVYLYEADQYEYFDVMVYEQTISTCIEEHKPSVVLIGATPIGRSLAPRLASHFRTGLTADCTFLNIKPNSDLVQIRPAFGGNVMAQIVTPHTRPQFATVRYKMMDAITPRIVTREEQINRTIRSTIPNYQSPMKILKEELIPSSFDITKSDVLVVVGRGLKQKQDLAMIEELATLLGGQVAVTRPLVEQGMVENGRQIGLSGRSVKPKLMFVLGVSGAIQFTAGMSGSGCIVAVNSDPEAEIFKIADYAIVGDLYEWIPAFITEMKQGGMVRG